MGNFICFFRKNENVDFIRYNAYNYPDIFIRGEFMSYMTVNEAAESGKKAAGKKNAVLYTAFAGETNSSKILLDATKTANKLVLTNSFDGCKKEIIHFAKTQNQI